MSVIPVDSVETDCQPILSGTDPEAANIALVYIYTQVLFDAHLN